MADNVSVVIDFNSGSPGDLISVANLTSATNNASGISATWTLDVGRTVLEHTTTVTSTALPLLEPVICGGTTYGATSGRAMKFDLDLAVSLASSPIYEGAIYSFATNAVGNVTLGAMCTFNTTLATDCDILGIYGPFCVAQWRNAGATVGSHNESGSGSSNGALIPLTLGHPYWISLRRNEDLGHGEVVVQDGATGAFMGCSRGHLQISDWVQVIIHDYLVPEGGSFKHSFVTLAFDAKATLPLLPGSFVLPPLSFVVATDNTSNISLDFGLILGGTEIYAAFAYRIERSTDAGGSWSVIESDLQAPFSGSVSPYTDSTASVGVTYLYRIISKIDAWESVPAQSNPITLGAAVWYDTLDPAIADTTHSPGGSSEMSSVAVTLPDGVASKLRVWVNNVANSSGFKMALYDNSGNLLVSVTDTIVVTAIGFWKEIVIAPTDITAGSYKVAWSALEGSGEISYRFKNGAGHTDVATSLYSSFPEDPLPAPFFAVNGADAAGVHVAPPVTLSLATVLQGAPIF